jgi:hypothetical protein
MMCVMHVLTYFNAHFSFDFLFQVRVFTYAVGPTATPLAAVKWMACSNRGKANVQLAQ